MKKLSVTQMDEKENHLGQGWPTRGPPWKILRPATFPIIYKKKIIFLPHNVVSVLLKT